LRPNVTEREIQEHYIENLQRWWNPDAARIQHIFVDDPAKAAAVRSELNEGRPFVEVAERHSLDFAKLPNGVDIEEEVVAGQAYIPFIGMADPNLAQKLTLLPEGATTGPLQSARGIHWVRIAEKREGAPEPLENIREEVRAELERSLFEAAVREAGARIKERLSRENDYEVFADRLPRPTPRGGVILQSTPEGPP
jgi:parvulin-like peptidyl-prolyl isomerase